MKKFNFFLMSLITLSVLSAEAFATTVEHDGRFIYYRTSWIQLSKSDQVDIIDNSVELLRNELSTTLSQTTGLKTLSNSILASDKLDDLTAKAQQSVSSLDNYRFKDLLPKGILVFGGASAGAGFIGQLKLSGDLGLVILPTKVTRVDVQHNTAKTYFELAWSVVFVPHVYGGVGVGGGGSASVGLGIICGNLDKPEDFAGTVVSGSASAMAIAGIDLEAAFVYNHSAGKVFGLAVGEFDFGAEAQVGVDGNIGEIMPLSSYLKFLSSKADTSGTYQTTPVPAAVPAATAAVPAQK